MGVVDRPAARAIRARQPTARASNLPAGPGPHPAASHAATRRSRHIERLIPAVTAPLLSHTRCRVVPLPPPALRWTSRRSRCDASQTTTRARHETFAAAWPEAMDHAPDQTVVALRWWPAAEPRAHVRPLPTHSDPLAEDPPSDL